MRQNLTKLYEGANLSGATPNLIYVPILADSTLNGADVLTDAAVEGANAVFSLVKNGVTIAGAGVTINTGQKIGSVSGLNVALVKGDEIVLNLVSGAVSSPVTLNLATENSFLATGGDVDAEENVVVGLMGKPMQDVRPHGLVPAIGWSSHFGGQTSTGGTVQKISNNGGYNSSSMGNRSLSGACKLYWEYPLVSPFPLEFFICLQLVTTPQIEFFNELDFAFKVDSTNLLTLWANGAQIVTGATYYCYDGDDLTLTRRGDRVYYSLNGVDIWNMPVVTGVDMVPYVIIRDVGTEISNVQFTPSLLENLVVPVFVFGEDKFQFLKSSDLAFNKLPAGGTTGQVLVKNSSEPNDVAWATAAVSTEAVQDIVAAMMISGANSSWIYDDVAGTLKVDAPQLTTEEVQDRVAAVLANGTNVTVNYNDDGNLITISSTDTNRTDEEIQDVVAALLANGTNVTLTYNDLGNLLTVNASAGTTIPPGDLNTTTNVLERMQGRIFDVTPLPTTTVNDAFGAILFSEGIWQKITGTVSDMPLSNVSGAFTIGTSPTVATTIDSGIQTLEAINFVDKFCQAQLTQWTWTGHTLRFGIWKDSTNFVYFEWNGNNDFSCRSVIAGVDTSSSQVNLNPIAGNYFRVQHDSVANSIVFQTSPNGLNSWTTRRTVTNMFAVSSVRVRFTLSGGAQASGFEKKFDNFTSSILTFDGMADFSMFRWNKATSRIEDATPAEVKTFLDSLGQTKVNLLTEAFTVSPLDAAKWSTLPGEATVTGGRLRFVSTNTNPHLQSAITFVGDNAEISVEVPTSPVGTSYYTQLVLSTSNAFTNSYSIHHFNGNLEMFMNGTTQRSMTYDGAAHRWWKIKFKDGLVIYQTSADGVTWVNRKTVADFLPAQTGLFAFLRIVNGSGVSRTSEYDNVTINSLPV